MSGDVRLDFLSDLQKRYGSAAKLPHAQSLFELGGGRCRVYIRYSKLHNGSQTFYGLRSEDLRQLEGRQAFIGFLWDGQVEPLLIPLAHPTLSHPQVQTLLGAIGAAKQYDVWVPLNDRPGLDWSLTSRYQLIDGLPPGFDAVKSILQEIDVVWVRRGAVGLAAVYEVEHSTPIYSGLLRLNDVCLTNPNINRLTVVSNEPRRAAFFDS